MTNLPYLEVLSVRQPYAWLIVQGKKPFENRDWSKHYPPRCRVEPGKRILIHASQGMTHDEYAGALATASEYGIELPEFKVLQRGGIVGSVVIRRWHDTRPNLPFAFGSGIEFQYGSARAFDLVKCRGALGFFRPVIEDLSEAQRLLRELEMVA